MQLKQLDKEFTFKKDELQTQKKNVKFSQTQEQEVAICAYY